MKEKPDCFGILDKVFPVGDSGIREVRKDCIDCAHRVECLRNALATEEGIRMRQDMLKRAPVTGMGDWLKRWSEKKMLSRMLDEKESGFWALIWKDFKRVMSSSSSFFSEIHNKTLGSAFIFGLIMGSIGAMFSLFWKIFILADRFPSVLDMLKQDSIGSMDLIIFMSFLILPLIVICGIFIYSFIIHFFLSIFGAAKAGIKATISVICYSQAPEIFCIVPMLGSIVASIWRAYIQVVGLKHVHQTSYFKVIMAFVVPLLLFLLFMISLMKFLYHIVSGVIS